MLGSLSVEARLLSADSASGERQRAARQQEFLCAFGFLAQSQSDRIFTRLWQGPRPSHPELWAWAFAPRHLESRVQPSPGAGCPVCGFTTFAWADPSELPASVIQRVRVAFPVWDSTLGLCQRCAEIYSIPEAAYPPTVVSGISAGSRPSVPPVAQPPGDRH